MRRISLLLNATLFLTLPVPAVPSQLPPEAQGSPTVAVVNGRWFNGKSFETRTVYSVNGRFTFKKPARVVRTLDAAGTWIVPPFGDAHNHNIGTGMEDREKDAIRKYLADGVFYVKIQGNLPLTDDTKRRLSLNRYDSVDVVVAQGSLTATGGHPIALVERILLPQGYYPAHTTQTLKDHRYFTVDSEAELERKWPLVLRHRPDFLKTFLWFSDEFEKRKDDVAYFGQKGLDPRLLPKIVERAHASSLRVSTHVMNAADFHNAVAAGVDEIAHLPLGGTTPIAAEDARLAAKRGTVVVTTCALVLQTLPWVRLPEADIPKILATQIANLKLLRENGVQLAIGSDNVSDTSVKEVEYLQGLGVFDNLTLLKMWTETTAKTIFPNRRIGALGEGYEASFLALEGNPIEELQNVRKIKMRFKQGVLIER